MEVIQNNTKYLLAVKHLVGVVSKKILEIEGTDVSNNIELERFFKDTPQISTIFNIYGKDSEISHVIDVKLIIITDIDRVVDIEGSLKLFNQEKQIENIKSEISNIIRAFKYLYGIILINIDKNLIDKYDLLISSDKYYGKIDNMDMFISVDINVSENG